jgi:two-component system KDP operon response regulator KdpE
VIDSASLFDGSPNVARTVEVPASELPRLRELATRLVEALHGRDEHDAERVAFGDVELDMSIREVRRAGRPVNLTPREYGILAELARHRGEPVTYRQLLEVVWGPQYTREVHYLRVYMSSLRRKLERDRGRPRYLITQGGVGYMLAA